ncbi:MAG: penicillin-insensitive murein endopeptidase [Labilithrix sp.]|nr:penicillin-insensitive murein endopeptidase [Labilithrix sp.]
MAHVAASGVRAMRAVTIRRAWLLALALTGCAGARPRAPAPPHEESVEASPARASGTALETCEETPSGDDDAPDAEHSTIDDGFEAPAELSASGPAPLADLSDADLEARLKGDLAALGSMSIGRTNGGALVSGVRMPEGENWEVVHPALAWGTRETVDALAHAIDAVAAKFPGTPKAFIGDISAKNGGHLHPHVSHQSGRDVDLGYYLTGGHRWYANAAGENLDKPRTWHLVRTLIADSDIDLILVDTRIQRVLKAYALEIGEDPAWLDAIFQVGGKSKRPLLFHVSGHATHLHVRFFNPTAQELGRRAYRFLVSRRVVSPPTLYVTHTVKAGETLGHLALRYKVTPEAIKKANALTKDIVRLNKPYKIPQPGGVAVAARASIPPRRVPPPLKTASEPAPRGGAPCRKISAR